MKNKYIPTAAGLYLNYLIHGMGVLLITLNMAHLQEQWGTDAAGVSIVISSLGIGKLATIVTGFLSDRFGRKPFIYLGILSYLIFFVGILLTKNIYLAYVFGIMAGLANSFLDSGTYPALMESFPHSASRANVLIKAFVSAGQFLLPFIISLLIWANLWFGWSFVIAAALFILSAIYLLKMPFPDSQAAKKEEIPAAQAAASAKPQANKLDMVIFTLYGYIGMATFYLVSQWLAQYGQFVVGMPYASAIKLLSIYTVGSLVCVFVTAAFVKEVFSSAVAMIIYTCLSMVSLLLVCLFPTPVMVTYMTTAVTVKNITFKEGETLICVPLIGKTLDELLTNAQGLVDAGADIIEWRVDHFTHVREIPQVLAALAEIRHTLKALPLLFTFRSKKEGGETEISDEAYFELNRQAALSGLVDVIDIELFNDEAQIRALVNDAHQAGVKVIMSNHDFHKTPAQEDIIYRLRRMQDLGADLPKIAVMPQTPQDVLTLLSATLTMKEKYATRPLITMSMGKSGGVSRVTGRLFGSAMTFGTVGQASAPGQIAISKLRELMDILS